MFYVPLYFEAIRSRPVLVFWLATLAQAVLWLVVPMLFYTAPPAELAQVLAIGHEFQFDSDVGPPLAFWLAEIAFRIGGLFGVYVLAQICVVATYWAVFKLGSAIVGPTQAVIAVLLMVGISPFTVPSPDFGPPVLAMALWALVLLFYWEGVTQGRRQSWYGVAGAGALLLLTSEAALILLGPLALFTVFTARGRAALDRIGPWIAVAVLVGVLFVHLLWLEGASDSLTPIIARLRDAGIAGKNTISWLRLLVMVALAHAGLVILAGLAAGWPRGGSDPLPVLQRGAVDTFARSYVKVFAVVPALLSTILAVVLGQIVADRRCCAAGRAVGAGARGHRRRRHRALSPAHSRLCLGGAAAGAGHHGAGADDCLAVDARYQSGGCRTGLCDGPFLRRHIRQPDRASARRRHRRDRHRGHCRAGGAKPPQRLFRG